MWLLQRLIVTFFTQDTEAGVGVFVVVDSVSWRKENYRFDVMT